MSRPSADSDRLWRAIHLERDALADEADDIRSGLAGAGERRVPALFLVELDRSRHLLDAELSWLDDLLDRLRDGRLPWQLPDRHPPHERHDA